MSGTASSSTSRLWSRWRPTRGSPRRSSLVDRLGVLAVRGQGGQPGPHSFFTVASAEPPVICFTSVGPGTACAHPADWGVRRLSDLPCVGRAGEPDRHEPPGPGKGVRRRRTDPRTQRCGHADPSGRIAGGAPVPPSPRSTPISDLGPGTSVTGFPPGQVDETIHEADGVALVAKNDLVAAYDDAAGRPTTATVPVNSAGAPRPPGCTTPRRAPSGSPER
jgi:hypothetical protein